jgi:ribonuclease R
VDVQVKSVDYYRQQIDLVAVGGGSQVPEDDDPGSYGDDEGDSLGMDLGQDEGE